MSDNNILPVMNISTTHNEDRKIVDFSKLTAKSRFETFENHEQFLKNLKQEVTESVELHYNNITEIIDGKEIRNHIGDKEIEQKGARVSTHYGDSTKVHNGDKIEILNGKRHKTHFGDNVEIVEGKTNITQNGDYSLETKNLEINAEKGFRAKVNNAHVDILENKVTTIGNDNSTFIRGNSILEIYGNKNENVKSDFTEKIEGTKNSEIMNTYNRINNDSITEIGNNCFTKVNGNSTSIFEKNKSEQVNGSIKVDTVNHFSTVKGVYKRNVLNDDHVEIHGNKTVQVKGTIVEKSNNDISLLSEKSIRLNAQEKKFIGGYTEIDTLVLTSPNGVRWGLVVDNDGKLKAALMSDE